MSDQSVADDRLRIHHRAGIGLKAAHYRTIVETWPHVGFFEVHAENYMGDGGPPHRYLSAVRERYPLSLHGVGLSIGRDGPLDTAHLQRLKALTQRYAPALVSEHLAWSSHDAGFLNDLLPLPYTSRTLAYVASHIDEMQETLQMQILLENPSAYVAFAESSFEETEFIAEIVRRTGCRLLLDINNVYVTSVNQNRDPFAYIDAFPLAAVGQIHLAGHAKEADDNDRTLLIDTHDRPVDETVWRLYAHAMTRIGPVPTLIEWDARVPAWPDLLAQAQRAEAVMRQAASSMNRPMMESTA